MRNVCELKFSDLGKLFFDSQDNNLGKLLPKDGKTYQIMIDEDNPDIKSLTTEKRLTEQACMELEKQIGYNIKIWIQSDGFSAPGYDYIDARISFVNTDPFFGDNTLAYGGYPFGSLRGKVVFNNKYAWLDGYSRYGFELRELGIILPNMDDSLSYRTFNYRQTIKHELCGHVFGLPHTDDPNDVMNAFYASHRIMFGKESKDTLNSKYGHANFIKRALPDSYIKAVMKRRL